MLYPTKFPRKVFWYPLPFRPPVREVFRKQKFSLRWHNFWGDVYTRWGGLGSSFQITCFSVDTSSNRPVDCQNRASIVAARGRQSRNKCNFFAPSSGSGYVIKFIIWPNFSIPWSQIFFLCVLYFLYSFHVVTCKQNGEQVFVAANSSGYVIVYMILQ